MDAAGAARNECCGKYCVASIRLATRLSGVLHRFLRFDRSKSIIDAASYIHLLLEETGKSFTHHVLEQRLQKAATLLRDPGWRTRKIADIATEAGFTELSYFNRAFRRHYGATPSDIREAARGRE